MSTTIVGAKMVDAILFINEWKCREEGKKIDLFWVFLFSGFFCC